MKPSAPSDAVTRAYAAAYLAGFGLLLVALFCISLQLMREHNLGADFSLFQTALAGLLAAGWFFLAHHKRLFLLRSDPWGYGAYHFCLWITLTLLITGILLDPWHFSGISQHWNDAVASLEGGTGAEALEDVTLLELLRSGLGFFLDVFKSIFFALIGVLLRIALTILCVAALFAGLVTLIIMYFTDIKSGVLMVLLALLMGACGWFLQVTDPGVNYAMAGVMALLASALLAANWGSLYINVDVESYHPRFYRLIAQLNRQKRAKLSRGAVREQIAAMVGGEAGADTERVVDAIEARMVEEHLLIPQGERTYRPGFQKRLRIWHVFIGGLALLYIFNPGFGVLELIPDNLPIFGNLDEVGIGLWVFAWLYGLYREDRREALGDFPETPAPPAALAAAPPLEGQRLPSLPGAAPLPLLPREEHDRPTP